ncbi:hypothetical protein Clacol_007915 [Clathrus columnatus]|uniref:Fungal-type protein kinase domain-containing protein n=1 Tax=Clathrus columnatus TaxID=1419009 RepID=A0AAV5ALS3_9AGAM|nr:hypothetical protein Clacol_007915 [Clathrus columnatus]
MATPSAPRTPRSTTRDLSHSTPITTTSSSLPQSSGQTQHELKQKVKMEYSGQIFGSQKLFSKIFCNTISDKAINIVTDDCIKRFTKLSRLPPVTVFDEEEHYQPFVERLNAVKDSLTDRGYMKNSIYHRVKFEVYDRLMAGGVGNDAPLRPDALARIPSGIRDDKVFWEDVELCVEVKNKYGDMVAQGATYARSIFYAQRNRRFRLGRVSFGLFSPAWLCLSTNHHDLHTAGGQRSFIQDMARIWSCTDRWSAGFEDTCNNVRCFLEGFGTFSYRRNICLRTSLRGRRTRVDIIDDGDIWTNERPVQNEYVLRTIQGQDEYYISEEPSKQTGAFLHPNSKNSNTSFKKSATGTSQSEKSKPRRSPRIAEKRLALSKGCGIDSPSELPVKIVLPNLKYKTLILKDSWPIRSRETREADVFGIVNEQADESDNDDVDGDEHEDEKHQEFGIPVVLGCSLVTNLEGEVSDTASTFPCEGKALLTLWDDDGPKQSSSSSSQTVEPEVPEERVHVRLLISTQGVPLEHARGPKQLLQAILHAMIGYSVIFKRRWLHRDVSIGNVLLMKKAKKRKRIMGFEDILTKDILEKYFEKCVGFITDGDLAVNWDTSDREHARQRSGTPPFMSCRLLRSMNQEVFHSAIDDLESFVWVLFWAILSVMQLRDAKFSKNEEQYWTSLRSRDLSTLQRKRDFPDRLFEQRVALLEQEGQEPGDPPVENAPSPAFAPFVGILRDWLLLAFSDEILLSGHRLRRTPVAEHERIVQEWIGKYLSIGIKHLDTLPDTWDYIPK